MAKCKAENEATLDRVIAAVRAETLREVRYEVEKVRQQITTRAAIEFPRPSAATKDAINALVSLTDGILAALDALAQPEGTDLAVPVDILSNEWWEREVGEAK
jgi:hypothetical protein